MIGPKLSDPMWQIKYEYLVECDGALDSLSDVTYADENEDFESLGFWGNQIDGLIDLHITFIGK